MSALSSSLIVSGNPRVQLSSGTSLKLLDQCIRSASAANLSCGPKRMGKLRLSTSRRPLVVRASSRDSGGPDAASIFVSGFVLGGVVVGALGCVFAPQLSEALVGENRKELLRKLPKFIYDEEKALEKTRKILTEKIAELNSAIDKVALQLGKDVADIPEGVYFNSDEYGV